MFPLVLLSCAATVYKYTATQGTVLNPDRGFYHYTDCPASAPTPLVLSDLKSYTQSGISLIFRSFVLDSFLTSAISQSYLTTITNDFATLRTAGVNVVLRFCYTLTSVSAAPWGDAAPSIVQQHLTQLKPLLQSNLDLITVFQNGFIGIWGEAYYTDYFGGPDDYPLNPTYAGYRLALAAQMLDAVAPSRSISARTVYLRSIDTGRSAALTGSELLDSSINATRIFLFDDAFVSSVAGQGLTAYADDMGTYASSSERVLYHTDSTYGITGGESDNPNSYSNCTGAQYELAYFHYTYLNTDYHPDIITSWQTGGCYNTIANSLGYRFTLSNLTTTVVGGNSLSIQFSGFNSGYGVAHNQRTFRVLAQTVELGNCTASITSVDVSRWLGQSPFSASFTVSFPGAISSTVKVYFEIFDPISTVVHPYRRVVFANVETTQSVRINHMFNQSLTLSAGTSGYVMQCSSQPSNSPTSSSTTHAPTTHAPTTHAPTSHAPSSGPTAKIISPTTMRPTGAPSTPTSPAPTAAPVTGSQSTASPTLGSQSTAAPSLASKSTASPHKSSATPLQHALWFVLLVIASLL